ncbi:hypothetical protein [Legionella impletisoli]|uniref:WD40 repeat domain-containing protein n=1 Tax=Legionella impletisoli TaxID=343510 RepID=A0A917JRN1_9GAMM|nr:hypothetical protein [Legionella impletisoli]GGI83747.1 hypothetical protein GCM10007966_10440 [Legionella impletisoli]
MEPINAKRPDRITIKLASVFIFILCVFLWNIFFEGKSTYSGTTMLSVSSDGRYVISAHYGRYLILWDIATQTKTILNRKCNIYSPFFIPESHQFIWQNAKTNDVVLQDVQGHVIKTFNPGFQVYGHLINHALTHYVASTINWELHHFNQGKERIIRPDTDGETATAQLLRLSLVEPYFLSSGNGDEDSAYPINIGTMQSDVKPDIPKSIDYSLLDGVVLWDLETGKPIKKFVGNSGKTLSTISPNRQYIIAVDESIFTNLWDSKTGKRLFNLEDPVNPNMQCWGNQQCLKELAEDIKNSKPLPKDFYSHPWANGPRSVAVKFIDEQGHFIRFINSVNYGILYHVSSPKILEFLDFGKNPQPHTFSVFENANTIATAPKANILVMGQTTVGDGDNIGNGSGIIVYRFDEQTKRLIRLWAPDGPKDHWRVVNPENDYEG